MRLILFLLNSKFKNFIAGYRNPVTIIAHVLLLLSALSYGIIFSAGINYFAKLQQANNIRICFTVSYYTFFLLPVLGLFIPSYSPKITLFQKIDPVSHVKRTAIEIINNIFSPRLLLFILVILLTFCLSPHISIVQFLSWIEIYLLASIVCLTIQTIIDLHSKKAVGLAIILAAIICCLPVSFEHLPVNIAVLAAVAVTTACYHSLQYLKPAGARKINLHATRTGTSIFKLLATIYFKTPPVRINLAITFLFKLGPLLALSRKPLPAGIPTIHVIYLLLSGSLIFFTYIHNNIWGYLKTTYEMVSMRGNIRSLLTTYLVLISFPVTADILFSSAVLWNAERNPLHSLPLFLLYYGTTVFCNILIGFLASINEPSEIKRGLDFASFKSNASLPYNLLSMTVSTGITLLFLYVPMIYFAPAIILFTGVAFYTVLSRKTNITRIFKEP